MCQWTLAWRTIVRADPTNNLQYKNWEKYMEGGLFIFKPYSYLLISLKVEPNLKNQVEHLRMFWFSSKFEQKSKDWENTLIFGQSWQSITATYCMYLFFQTLKVSYTLYKYHRSPDNNSWNDKITTQEQTFIFKWQV